MGNKHSYSRTQKDANCIEKDNGVSQSDRHGMRRRIKKKMKYVWCFRNKRSRSESFDCRDPEPDPESDTEKFPCQISSLTHNGMLCVSGTLLNHCPFQCVYWTEPETFSSSHIPYQSLEQIQRQNAYEKLCRKPDHEHILNFDKDPVTYPGSFHEYESEINYSSIRSYRNNVEDAEFMENQDVFDNVKMCKDFLETDIDLESLLDVSFEEEEDINSTLLLELSTEYGERIASDLKIEITDKGYTSCDFDTVPDKLVSDKHTESVKYETHWPGPPDICVAFSNGLSPKDKQYKNDEYLPHTIDPIPCNTVTSDYTMHSSYSFDFQDKDKASGQSLLPMSAEENYKILSKMNDIIDLRNISEEIKSNSGDSEEEASHKITYRVMQKVDRKVAGGQSSEVNVKSEVQNSSRDGNIRVTCDKLDEIDIHNLSGKIQKTARSSGLYVLEKYNAKRKKKRKNTIDLQQAVITRNPDDVGTNQSALISQDALLEIINHVFNFRTVLLGGSITIGAGLDIYFRQMLSGPRFTLHGSMRFEWLRIGSFGSYPTRVGISTLYLARWGFYATGNSNETRCFCCNVTYSEWYENSNVAEIHLRISPECQFMNGNDSGNVPVHVTSSGPLALEGQHFAIGNGSDETASCSSDSQQTTTTAGRIPELSQNEPQNRTEGAEQSAGLQSSSEVPLATNEQESSAAFTNHSGEETRASESFLPALVTNTASSFTSASGLQRSVTSILVSGTFTNQDAAAIAIPATGADSTSAQIPVIQNAAQTAAMPVPPGYQTTVQTNTTKSLTSGNVSSMPTNQTSRLGSQSLQSHQVISTGNQSFEPVSQTSALATQALTQTSTTSTFVSQLSVSSCQTSTSVSQSSVSSCQTSTSVSQSSVSSSQTLASANPSSLPANQTSTSISQLTVPRRQTSTSGSQSVVPRSQTSISGSQSLGPRSQTSVNESHPFSGTQSSTTPPPGSQTSSGTATRTGRQRASASAQSSPQSHTGQRNENSGAQSGNLQTIPTNSVAQGDIRFDPLGINFDRPRYPAYAVLTIRLSTFDEWPSTTTQTPHQLATAGFFSAGYGDYVRCFFCGGGLRNWEPGDDPWVEHARWFTRCAFIRLNKGEKFVHEVRERHLQREAGITPVPEPSPPEIPDLDLPASLTLKEMGYELATIQQAIDIWRNRVQLDQLPVPDMTAASLIDILEDVEEHHSQATGCMPPDKNRLEDPSGTDVSDVVNTTEETSAAEELTQSNSLETLREEYQSLTMQLKCKICTQEPVAVAFLPCGHLVCCRDCAPAMRICPMCKEIVKGTVKTFFA